MFTYTLEIYQKILPKIARFSNQSEFRKKSSVELKQILIAFTRALPIAAWSLAPDKKSKELLCQNPDFLGFVAQFQQAA